MFKYIFFPLVLVLFLFVTACNLDDALPISPTLVVINTQYDATNTIGQSIGIVPAISLSNRHVRFATGTETKKSVRPLLKDLPLRLTRAATKASPTRGAKTRGSSGITDTTTTHTFMAYNAEDTQISVSATRRAMGTNCYVFVEDGEEGSHNWQSVAQLFDTKVWVKNTEIFGMPTDVDANNKIVILYFKMKDNANNEVPNILGYFYPGDLFTDTLPPDVEFSNGMEVFYMNLAFGQPLHSEMQRTLFHEFQHMINYGQRKILNLGRTEMDTCIDEGLAESAEHYGLDTPGKSRIDSMNSDSRAKIRNGLSLVNWGGEDESYGLSYTFMQYCRLQADDWTIMTDLINHAQGDYRALEAVMGNKVSDLNTFEKLLKGYHLARLVNGSGINGFKGENSTFRFTLYPPTDTLDSSFTLLSGGAIYIPTTQSDLDAFAPNGAGPDISFTKFSP
jgi:hypothetical protein